MRFEKTIKILFERQNIFLLFLINPNVLHSYLPASGSKLNKLDTDTIFHSKQLRRTLKFTDKYGAIEKAVAPTKRLTVVNNVLFRYLLYNVVTKILTDKVGKRVM